MEVVVSARIREGRTYAVILAPALLALTLLVAVPFVQRYSVPRLTPGAS